MSKSAGWNEDQTLIMLRKNTIRIAKKFKIVTDCEAFKHTLKSKELSARIARWALMLKEYEYEAVHRPGSSMKHVYALSRTPVMIVRCDPMIEAIRPMQKNDDPVKAIGELLKIQSFEDFAMSNGLLMKVVRGREVIVVPSGMQSDMIRGVHENGHLGARKLKGIIEQEFYIPNASEKIRQAIECCVKCILAERKGGKVDGLLNPIAEGDVPLDTYHVDHLGPMDRYEQNKYRSIGFPR